MPVYAVTGNLGSGKTLVCVGRIREALLSGRRVATNLDLRLEFLSGARSHPPVIRLPDHPKAEHLEQLGVANESRDESLNGLLVLDEAGAWLNSRGWADKDRHAVVEWMLHARKRGWDVYLIVQHEALIDKQVRVSFVEHIVRCRRLDRFPVPFIGAVMGWAGGILRLPQVHIGVVSYGTGPNAPVVERWYFRGRDLWDAYETRQIFVSGDNGPRCLLGPQSASWLRPGPVYMRWRLLKGRVLKAIHEFVYACSAQEALYRWFRVVEVFPGVGLAPRDRGAVAPRTARLGADGSVSPVQPR